MNYFSKRIVPLIHILVFTYAVSAKYLLIELPESGRSEKVNMKTPIGFRKSDSKDSQINEKYEAPGM